jgi:hypothetical protein
MPPIWFGPVLAAMGATFMVFTVLGWQNTAALADRGVVTTGSIVAKDVRRDEDSTTYVLRYEFMAPDRSRHGGTGSVSRTTFDATAIGAEAMVTYFPDDPTKSVLGVAGPPSPLLFGGVLAMCGLFVVVGIRLTVLTIRRRRSGGVGEGASPAGADSETGSPFVPGERLPGDPGGEPRAFRRPPSRVVIDLLGPPIVAVLFLGAAALFVTGTIEPGDVVARLVFPLVFGFFGIFLALSSVASIRRGTRRTILQVGPAGIWTPETDWLRWDEIAEVRLEDAMAGPSTRATPRAGYRRLGIVPIDPGRAPAASATRLLGIVTRGLAAVARQSGRRGPAPMDAAAIGFYDYELTGGLGPVIAAVRGHRGVADRTQAGVRAAAVAAARSGQPGADTWATPPPTPAPAPARELTRAEVAELDALLAPGAIRAAVPHAVPPAADGPIPGHVTGPSGAAFDRVPALVAVADRRPATSRAYRPPSGFLSGRPFGRLSDLGTAGREAFFSLLVIFAFVVVASRFGGDVPIWFGLAFLIILAPLAVWAVLTLLELPSRLGRVLADDDTALDVGPRGIWLPVMDRVAWDAIASIRVGSLGTSSVGDDDTGSADHGQERWRITVVPRDAARLADRRWSLRTRDRLRAAIGRFVPMSRGWKESPGFSVDSDRLDAPIDEVVDLIAAYHPVDVLD